MRSLKSLNPCFSGCYSLSSLKEMGEVKYLKVLILVFLDVTL